MKRAWFKPWGGIYRPTTWQAWSLLIATCLFCVQVFLAVDRHSHSVSDTLYGVFPFFVPAFGILGGIASHTSGKA
jgi:drug/metabolite transporter (DMT)-like permease